MTRQKRIAVWLLAVLSLFLLTGCGEQGKYDEAAAQLAAGDFAKAYEGFDKLGNFSDAKEQAKQVKQKLADRAEESLFTGDYAQTIEDLERSGIVMSNDQEKLDDYAHNALDGTYIQGLALEDGLLSCRVAVAKAAADPSLYLELTAKGGPIGGTVRLSPWDGEAQPKENFLIWEEYGSNGQYTLDKVSLNERNFTMVPKEVSFFDSTIFTPATLAEMNMTMMYKAIALDGREGFSPAKEITATQFVDVMTAFAGGTLDIGIRSGEETLFALTLTIPGGE